MRIVVTCLWCGGIGDGYFAGDGFCRRRFHEGNDCRGEFVGSVGMAKDREMVELR